MIWQGVPKDKIIVSFSNMGVRWEVRPAYNKSSNLIDFNAANDFTYKYDYSDFCNEIESNVALNYIDTRTKRRYVLNGNYWYTHEGPKNLLRKMRTITHENLAGAELKYINLEDFYGKCRQIPISYDNITKEISVNGLSYNRIMFCELAPAELTTNIVYCQNYSHIRYIEEFSLITSDKFVAAKEAYIKQETDKETLQKAILIAIISILLFLIATPYIVYRISIIYRRKRIEKNDRKYQENLNSMIISDGSEEDLKAGLGLKKEEKLDNEGTFGIVYRGTWKKGDESVTVAIKEFRDIKRDDFGTIYEGTKRLISENIIREANNLRQMNHEYLVRFCGICYGENGIQIVTALCELGSLKEYLEDNKDNIKERRLLLYCHQISLGMSYLASEDFIHCDLAARNVFLCHRYKIQIGDFGLTRKKNRDDLTPGLVIPMEAAVELINRTGKFSEKSDVWSFGILCWVIFKFGEDPYPELKNMSDFDSEGRKKTEREKLKDFLKQKRRMEIPKNVYSDLSSIIERCWSDKLSQRPKFSEIVEELERMQRAHGKEPKKEAFQRLLCCLSTKTRGNLPEEMVLMSGESIHPIEGQLENGTQDDSREDQPMAMFVPPLFSRRNCHSSSESFSNTESYDENED